MSRHLSSGDPGWTASQEDGPRLVNSFSAGRVVHSILFFQSFLVGIHWVLTDSRRVSDAQKINLRACCSQPRGITVSFRRVTSSKCAVNGFTKGNQNSNLGENLLKRTELQTLAH